MAEAVGMEYYSESESEGGLEDQYYSAKELLGSGTVEEALVALETVVELDVELSKWGFKALKQIVKLLMRENQNFTDYYNRLLTYVDAKSITTNDVDKTLDSLWKGFCKTLANEEKRRAYCLVTYNGIKTLRARTTRLKWAARLAQHYEPEEYPYDVEEMVDDVQLLSEKVCKMEGTNDNVKEYLFETLAFTSPILLKLRRLSIVDDNLKRLKEFFSEVDERDERSALLKELQSQVTFVRGKYADSFKLLWDAGTLYDECGSSRSQQAHLQLRLVSMLVPAVGTSVPRPVDRVTPDNAVWAEQCALVEDIVQCFLDDDVVLLRSLLARAEATLGRFAAVEICGALLRNRMSRRMAAENWLDSLACLSGWNVDALKLVGHSMSNRLVNNTHTLPLKKISNVRVESAHADQTVRDCPPPPSANPLAASSLAFFEVYHSYSLTTSVHEGTLAIQTRCESVRSHEGVPAVEEWKTFATVATTERFRDYSNSFRTCNVTYSAIGCLQPMLANAFVEQFDWVGNFSWPNNWEKQHAPAVYIKRLNYAFNSLIPRLLPLRSLGEVSVELLEIDVQEWRWACNKDLRDLFEPLEGTKVKDLSVKCARFSGGDNEASLAEVCFAPHTTQLPLHFVVQNAHVRSDFLMLIVDVSMTFGENFVHSVSALPDCSREDLGQLRIFNFDWPTNSLRIELEPYKLVARYSWKRIDD